MIPGIPIQTRIAILQQTSNDGTVADDSAAAGGVASTTGLGKQVSVLEDVIDEATSRSDIQHEIDGPYNVMALLQAFC